MIDLHQGFSGQEPAAGAARVPTVTDAAMAQLDAVQAASRGRWRIAAAQQVEAFGLLARVAGGALRRRLVRR